MKWNRPKQQEKTKQRLSRRISDKIPERFRNRQKNVQTISSILPNFATILALCAGLSSVRFALENKWELAVVAILVAGILDATDGKLARLLGSTSRFGAELDSLSDFICFGISPALVIYLKTLHHLGGMGWILTLFFSVCMGLRLARFNTISIEETEPNWSQGFFVGVPAPAAGMLALTPMIMHFVAYDHGWGSFMLNPYFNGCVVFIVSCLMVSRIPTFSIKKLHIPHKYVLPLMLMTALTAGAIYVEPWIVLSCISVGYLGLIPLSIKAFSRTKKEYESTHDSFPLDSDKN